ncbi:MAG: energy transducer TonB [Georgfuchsia sp.]
MQLPYLLHGGITCPAEEHIPSRLIAALALSLVLHAAVLLNPGRLLIADRIRNGHPTEPISLTLLVPAKSHVVHSTVAPTSKTLDAPPRKNAMPEVIHHRPGLVLGPWYFTSRYLHRQPRPLRPIWPVYPPELTEVRGKVLLLLFINEKGGIDDYKILESEPADQFDPSVIAAFTHAVFAPGSIADIPVKSQMLIEVNFEPGLAPQTAIRAEPSN